MTRSGDDGRRAIDGYSRIAERYEEEGNLRSVWGLLAEERIAALEPSPAWKVVADIGCGTGASSRALAARLAPDARLIGVEPADGMRAVAERACAGDPRIELRAGAFEALPLETASVDALFSMWAFHWSVDPAAAVAEMARVLRPDGDIELFFVGRHTGGRFSEVTSEVLGRHLDWEERLGSARVMQSFDRAAVEALFARFGPALTVEESFPEVVAPLEAQLAWLIRMEGQFALLEGERRAAFDRDLRAALAELERDGGVPYTAHVLHVRVDGARRGGHEEVAPSRESWGELLAALPAASRPARARSLVRELVAEVLGRPLAEGEEGRGLRDLGLDSLDAVTLARRLAEQLGRPVPNTVLFSHPSVAALAELVLAPAGDGRPVAASEAPRRAAPEASAAAPIAIIGMACRFPGGVADPDAFWELLAVGRDAITPLPVERWDGARLPAGVPPFAGLLDDLESFDAPLFHIAPTEARSMDPQQRLLLECAREAFEGAAIAPDRVAGSRTGVWVGISSHDQMLRLQRRPLEQGDLYSVLGSMPSVAAGRVAYTLGLAGPAVAVDTACSSSLVALHQACQALRAGEVAMALAGGVNCLLSPEYSVGFSNGRMLSHSGRCRSFDAAADGYVRAEGCGLLLLKRLDHALADGDRVVAVVRGSAVNQDGASSGLTAPRQPAQEAVMRDALAAAGLAPEAVDAVEAHGTGTVLGDAVELHALDAVFSARERPLMLSSVKSVIGHAEAAAGVAGVMRVILELHHQRYTPHLHLDTLNPSLDWQRSALNVPVAGAAWPRGERPRVAGVSSFGVGGTNAFVLLSEPPEERGRDGVVSTAAGRLLMLSAADDRALAELARRWRDRLRAEPQLAAAEVCHTAAVGRARLAARLAVTGGDTPALAAALERWLAAPAAVPGEGAPRIVFAFPGQGCQYPGMGRELYQSQPAFARALEAAAEALRPHMDLDPLALLFDPAHAERLGDTRYIQPAVFLIEYALAALWRAWGVVPDAVIGHSFGEYAAACVAGVMTLETAAELVAVRARLAAEIPADGGMAAVALGIDELAEELAGGEVVVAADNGPAAATLAGPAGPLDALVARLKGRSVKATRLDISHPFHSPRMAPMTAPFGEAVGRAALHPAQLPYASSVTGALEREAPADPDYWVRQVVEPVRFRAALEALAQQQDETLFIECGPRPVLMALARPQLSQPWLPTLVPGPEGAEVTAQTLAALFTAGVRLDAAALFGAHRPRRLSMPTYPFQRTRLWTEVPPPGTAALPSGGEGLLAPARRLADGTLLAEGTVRAERPGWVADHQVEGRILLPATGLIDALLDAAGAGGLDHLSIARPAVVPAQGALHLQLLGGADGTLRLHGRDGDEEEWQLLATATLAADGVPPPAGPSLDEARAACTVERDGAAVRTLAAARGIDFGPAFRTVTAHWAGDDLALVRLHDGGARRALLLDGCLQALLPLIEEPGSWLPFALDAVRLAAELPATLWCVARRRPRAAQAVAADLWLYDEAGEALGTLTGLTLRRLAGESGAHLTELAWRRRGRARMPPPAAFLPRPEAVAAAVVRRPAEPDAVELNRGLEAAAAAVAWEALEAVSGPLEAGRLVTRPAGIAAGHYALFARCLSTLVEAGLAEAGEGAAVRIVAPEPPPPAAGQLAALAARFPEAGTEIDIVRRSAEGLAEVLSGRRGGLEVLFPGGDLSLLAALYGPSVSMSETNATAAAVVERLVAAAPPGRALRILEIGGGTGGTTAALLPVLELAEVVYTFTDVGPRFVQQAGDRLGRLSRSRRQVLDVERPAAEQGIAEGSQDLVIAVNVLHATADVRATLERVRAVLAPGGLLLAVELTERRAWVDLHFGMTDQWAQHTDGELRPDPDHPLLDVPRWRRVLPAAGFTEVAVLEADPAAPTPASVILARAPEEAVAAAGEVLVVGMADGLGGHLARRLEGMGARVRLAHAAEAVAVWEALAREGRAPRRIVHLPAAEQGALPEAIGPACRSLLELVRTAGEACPEVVTATRGAVAVDPDEPLPGPVGGALWGMARALDLESPELAFRRIDLDPAVTELEAARTLADEVLGAEGSDEDPPEREVALRGAGRYVCRIAPLPAAPPDGQLALAVDEARVPAFRPAPRRAPGEGEVEIAVEAAGIAFPDVLQAAGLTPLERTAYGYDVAGVVSRVGPGVTRLAPGDAVLGLADGALAQYVVTDARLVVARPAGLAAEAAAVAPSAWLTARLTLDALAKVRPGERVLIHSAAGAVGTMALQLARARGCEVFATAHPGKAAVLRARGVDHPLSSRDTGFGRRLLELTGGRGVDVILNALTSDEAMEANLTALAVGGRFVEIGKRGAWSAERMAGRRPDVVFQPFDLYGLAAREPKRVTPLLRELAAALAKGALQAPLGPRFEAARVAEGFALMRRGFNVGKPVVRPPPTAPHRLALPAGAGVLITGGLGGLGLAMAARLVERGARRLILAARREPDAGQAAALEGLRRDDAEVSVVLADLSSADGVQTALATARTGGPLGGIVHAAGILRDGHHRRLPWADFAAVLAPKLDAAWQLHRLTRDDPLCFFVVFGSLAGIAGNAGQTAHAAASAGLDALMRHRHGLGLPGLALDLGRVTGVGAAADEALGALLAARGIDGVGVGEVLDGVERLLAEGRPQAALAAVRWPLLAAQPGLDGQGRFAEVVGDAAPAAARRAPVESTAAAPTGDGELEALRTMVAAVLGGAAETVPLDTPLILLGLDSLMAVDLRDRLQKELGRTVAMTRLIGGVTVRGLAEAGSSQ
ncbi:SDR family NAD(P)-dependent oxidoreductase [Endothiovibrio diazotrophicus]